MAVSAPSISTEPVGAAVHRKPCSAGSYTNTAVPLDRRSAGPDELRLLGTHSRSPNPGAIERRT
jgi:hypothetical protein